jgi:geranylgeranyl diphosphate synthase type II
MVTGQQLDLEAEGKKLSIVQVKNIHSSKTGALIEFSVTAGAMIGNANERELDAVRDFGESLGLLFQITDDLLDVTETSESLGKTPGKDAAAEKATYPKILGVEAATELAAEVADEARSVLGSISRSTAILEVVIDYLLSRRT